MVSDSAGPPPPRRLRLTARGALVAFGAVAAAVALLMPEGTRLAAEASGERERSVAVSDRPGATGERPAPSTREGAYPQQPQALPDAGGPRDDAHEPALPVSHRVEAGETLSSIAGRYDLDADRLARRNAIEDARALPVGRHLVLPEPGGRRPASVAEARQAELPVERVIEEVAAEFGWRADTVKAVAWVESRWTQRLVSSRGAVGVMQVLPPTGQKASAQVNRDLDLYDLRDNVTAGVAYLDHLHAEFDADLEATLAAYVQGPTSLRRHGAYPISVRYVEEVLEAREQIRG